MTTARFYEFRVLLFLPGHSPAGVRGFLRLKDSVMEFNAPGVWITLLADQVRLRLGGYDGRQWVLSWDSEAGPASAMLTGKADVYALRRIAPPVLVEQIDAVLGQRGRHRRGFGRWLLGLLFIALIVLLAYSLAH